MSINPYSWSMWWTMQTLLVEFLYLNFSGFYEGPKSKFCHFWPKNAKIWTLDPYKIQKNGNIKFLQITFENTPIQINYVKFWTSRCYRSWETHTFIHFEISWFEKYVCFLYIGISLYIQYYQLTLRGYKIVKNAYFLIP